MFDRPEDFYETYSDHRAYVKPELRRKHRRDFGSNIWKPCAFTSAMSVLEIGCGTGLFLAFVESQGIRDFTGIDADPKVLDYMPPALRERVSIISIENYLATASDKQRFDRVVMIDVLEHFSPGQAVALLQSIKSVLSPQGGIVVRVPNLASPWGAQWQYHDLTHKAGYTMGSLKQLGLAAGFDCTVTPYRRGNPRKQFVERIFHGLLNRILTEPPPMWSAAMIGFFQPRRSSSTSST